MLNREGRVLGTNELLQEMAPQIAIGGYDSLYFHHAAANRLLAEALEQRRVRGSLASRYLPQLEQHPPAVVHIVAVEGNARDIFTNAAALLVVTPIDRTRVPTAETIQGLYDLSPAEARIARALAAGNTVNSVAAELSISPETVRTHVKAILSKSGMSRQADFVAAIASIRSI